MQLAIVLGLWALALLPPLVRRPLVARSAATHDPMSRFHRNLSSIDRTTRPRKTAVMMTSTIADHPDARPFAEPLVDEQFDPDPFGDERFDDEIGLGLRPASAAEAQLRRRCVGATLVAITLFAVFTIPALGVPAVLATLAFGTLSSGFGWMWWQRNQAPNPFSGILGAPLPSHVTARNLGESEPTAARPVLD